MIHADHTHSLSSAHSGVCAHALCDHGGDHGEQHRHDAAVALSHGAGNGSEHAAITLPDHASALSDASAPRSFFFGVMGTPFQSELTTTLFRMVQSALDMQHQVTVWTCGYATNLTQHSLVRPKDSFAAKEAPSPNNLTTAQVVQALMQKHSGNLNWYVCRYCMEERGATQQIPEIQIKIPFTFQHYLSEADVSLVLGVK